jgi:uncharacterized protein
MAEWKSRNYDGEEIKFPSQPFTLTCSPETDLWDKPPSVHSDNAPSLLQRTTKDDFISAKVTVTADWAQKYDQGGLVLLISPESNNVTQWVKTGIEFLNGQPQVSTVATNTWSDWSLRPMAKSDSKSATIEIESNEDGSLWAYLLDDGGNKSPMREVTWWGDLDKSTQISVGVYAAKPDKDPRKLVVSFEGLEVSTRTD